jgi:hypothetical protein
MNASTSGKAAILAPMTSLTTSPKKYVSSLDQGFRNVCSKEEGMAHPQKR